jgi:Phage tail lysozyme
VASLPTGPFLNAEAIYKGLLALGLNANAAAGVAGNIYQESHGNPGAANSAGGGLFGETVQNSGSVGGGTLAEQLAALAKYISANGSVADINAHASSPSAAAAYFSAQYERPGIPALSNREAAANWVAEAAQSGNWGAGVAANPASGGGGGLLDLGPQITGFFTDADKFVTALMWLVSPGSWVRIGAFIAGVALILLAAHALLAVGEGTSLMPEMPKVMPVPI